MISEEDVKVKGEVIFGESIRITIDFPLPGNESELEEVAFKVHGRKILIQSYTNKTMTVDAKINWK